MTGGTRKTVAVLAAVLTAAAAMASSSLWTRLGEREVPDTVEHDSFELIIAKEPVTAVMLKVERRNAHILSLTLHFDDGTSQEATLDQEVKAGKVSDIVEIPGDGGRVVTKVDVHYKPFNRRKTQTSTVILLGRR